MRGICSNCKTPITHDAFGRRWIHDGEHNLTVTAQRSRGPVTFVLPCQAVLPVELTRT